MYNILRVTSFKMCYIIGTPTVAPSQQNKTAQQSTTTTSMGDIDLLGQSLMQQSLPKEYIKPIIPYVIDIQ